MGAGHNYNNSSCDTDDREIFNQRVQARVSFTDSSKEITNHLEN